MPLRFYILIAIFLTPHFNEVHAASFDCTKASTETEIAICGDDSLGVLDRLMALFYHQALQSYEWRYVEGWDSRDRLIAEQKAALVNQRKCGSDAYCLRSFYEARIKLLMAE